jgi:dTDP-4-dehydrorhamnose 3,5-epimerase
MDKDVIIKTKLEGVVIVNRPTFGDERGFFREWFRSNELEAATGVALNVVQTNHSRSAKDALRGLHIAPWHKLITVARGQVQQIVVDCREDSPTFGQHESIILGEDHWQSVFVPQGCGNGFLVLSDIADYIYLATDYWEAGKEKYLRYDDADVNIAWQTTSPLVSEKDMQNLPLREIFPSKF